MPRLKANIQRAICFKEGSATSYARRGRSLQTTDVGEVCRGWSHWTDECSETKNETAWTQKGCGKTYWRPSQTVYCR